MCTCKYNAHVFKNSLCATLMKKLTILTAVSDRSSGGNHSLSVFSIKVDIFCSIISLIPDISCYYITKYIHLFMSEFCDKRLEIKIFGFYQESFHSFYKVVGMPLRIVHSFISFVSIILYNFLNLIFFVEVLRLCP